MQHEKDEYIFQLVTRAVKEIDSSEICRKREIFKILAKSEVSLEIKQILAKSARVIGKGIEPPIILVTKRQQRARKSLGTR